MFMTDFGHIMRNVKCKQYCWSYYKAPLLNPQGKHVTTTSTAWRQALRTLWRPSPLTYRDVIALLSESLPLVLVLKQRFFRFINKAMNHSSLIIIFVAKVFIRNPVYICSANCHQTKGM